MAGEKPPDKRFVGGPRRLGALLPAVTKPVFRTRSAAAAQIMADWPEIVGPALAAVTHPQRLVSATLTIACVGPVALELQHLSGTLAERINGHFGRILVERFRFVQAEVTRPEARPAPPRRRARPIEVPEMPPGELRDALAALGGALARARSRERT